jgi:hypothetical protein
VVTAPFVFAAVRIALAIMLDTAALIIWNIGTRSPARLLSDIRSGLQRKSAIVGGLMRFAAGTLALILAAAVCAPVTSRPIKSTVIECLGLVTALVLEQLIGPDLRARRR